MQPPENVFKHRISGGASDRAVIAPIDLHESLDIAACYQRRGAFQYGRYLRHVVRTSAFGREARSGGLGDQPRLDVGERLV